MADYPDITAHELSRLRTRFANPHRYDWPDVLPPKTDGLPEGALASFVAGAFLRPSESGAEEPYVIRGLLRRDSTGVPIIGELSVESFGPSIDEPATEVTSTALRGVHAGTIRRRVLDLLPIHALANEAAETTGGRGISKVHARQARHAAELAAKDEPRRGRPRTPPEHYRRIALRHLEIVKSGRRDVLKVLAAEEGKPPETIRTWVSRATQLGFLAPGKQGKTQIRPGPNLYPTEGNDA